MDKNALLRVYLSKGGMYSKAAMVGRVRINQSVMTDIVFGIGE